MRLLTSRFNFGLILSAALIITGCGKKGSDDSSNGEPLMPKSDTSSNGESKNEEKLTPETIAENPEAKLAGIWANARQVVTIPDATGKIAESGSELRIIFNEGLVQYEKTCFGGGLRSMAQAMGKFSATREELTLIDDNFGQALEGEYPCEVKISKGVFKYTIDGDTLTVKGRSIYGTEFKRVKDGDKAREATEEEAKLAGTWTHGRILDWDSSGKVLKTDIETRWTFLPGAIRQVVECKIGEKTSVLVIEVKAIVWHGVIEILEGMTEVSPETTCYLSVYKGEKIPYVVEGNRLYLRSGHGNSDHLTRVSPDVLAAESLLVGNWVDATGQRSYRSEHASSTITRTGFNSRLLNDGYLMRLDVQMIVRPGELETLETKASPDNSYARTLSVKRGGKVQYTLEDGILTLNFPGFREKFVRVAK